MAHLPYADVTAASTRPLVDRIAAERGSVLHLYQMLLHSPPLAEGWLTFLTAVRHRLSVPGALRELIIMRVAVLNDAPYEAEQHRPVALAEGVSEAQLDALAQWRDGDLFSPPRVRGARTDRQHDQRCHRRPRGDRDPAPGGGGASGRWSWSRQSPATTWCPGFWRRCTSTQTTPDRRRCRRSVHRPVGGTLVVGGHREVGAAAQPA